MNRLFKNISKTTAFISFLVIILSITYTQINAQEDTGSGLSISPVVFELNSDPGDTITNEIKIYNPTDIPQNVKISVEDFSPVDEEGHVTLEEPDEDSTYSLAKWTYITPEEFVIAAKTQQIITFSINIPENGEPGGHYGSIVATISGGSMETTGSAVGTKRGALVLLRVAGDIKEEIIVNVFEAKSFQESGPVDFSVKFENTGNVHLKPAGFVTITDIWGKKVAEIEIPQNNVIPEAIRQANVSWEEEKLMGRYTATLVANYGTTEIETITAVTTFTVLPWKNILAIGIIILVIIVLVIRARKRIKLALEVLLGKH